MYICIYYTDILKTPPKDFKCNMNSVMYALPIEKYKKYNNDTETLNIKDSDKYIYVCLCIGGVYGMYGRTCSKGKIFIKY